MQIQLYPIISEKSMQQGGKGRFTFRVAGDGDKKAIKQAVEALFKVQVVSITTAIIKGRTRRGGPRREEKVLSSWKKAVVTLKDGQKIDIFDIV
jgi:large subunit ribosomal protein L23